MFRIPNPAGSDTNNILYPMEMTHVPKRCRNITAILENRKVLVLKYM